MPTQHLLMPLCSFYLCVTYREPLCTQPVLPRCLRCSWALGELFLPGFTAPGTGSPLLIVLFGPQASVVSRRWP